MTYIALLVGALLVGLDQLTKWLVTTNIPRRDIIELIKIGDTQILNFTHHINTGAAFGIGAGKRVFLIAGPIIIIAVGLYLLLSKKVTKPYFVWPAALILAGGMGNLIDRIFNPNGGVVDFIDFRVINFPIFNVADICAVVGSFALFFFVMWDDHKNKSKTPKVAKTSQSSESSQGSNED